MADVSMEDDLPLTQPVTRIRLVETIDKDRLGNPVTRQVEDDEPVWVHSWRIVSSDEPILAGHERAVVDARMVAAVGDFVRTDNVELPGEPGRFEVVGRPINVDHNPWLHVGREIVNLKEVSG